MIFVISIFYQIFKSISRVCNNIIALLLKYFPHFRQWFALAEWFAAAECHSVKQRIFYDCIYKALSINDISTAEIMSLWIVTAFAVMRTALSKHSKSESRSVHY